VDILLEDASISYRISSFALVEPLPPTTPTYTHSLKKNHPDFYSINVDEKNL